jgi:DNA-binding NarL/FixJ family response regulator
VIRVLIADDLALLRGSFRVLIEHSPDCTVVGEAADGVEAVALTAQLQPDVVLMDIRMPGLDGIEATRQICADPANTTRVLILTTFDLDEYVYGALRAGASGFLLKDARPPELLAGIRLVASGEAMLAPTVTRRLIGAFVRQTDSAALPDQAATQNQAAQRGQPAQHSQPPQRSEAKVSVRDPAGITGREREILTLIAAGLSNAEIAARLLLSVPTVKTHVGRLLTKCGARDRTQLVIVAYETGLVTPA